MDWFLLRVASNMESSVRETLLRKVQIEGLEERVGRIVVPTKKTRTRWGGRTRISETTLYPGYIFVEMKPEVEKMLFDSKLPEELPEIKMEFANGDNVTINEGPFENYEGTVDEVIPDKGLVRVLVTIFGRQAPVELEYWQIAKVEG